MGAMSRSWIPGGRYNGRGGQDGPYQGAATRCFVPAAGAAQFGGPLADRRQPNPGLVFGRDAAAIVGDVEVEGIVLVAHPHRAPAGAGMVGGVV